MIKSVFAWISVNLAGILGIVQAVIKFIKELCTVIINVLFPLFPDNGSFEKTVLAVRSFVEKIDAIVEKIKAFFLKVVG